MIHPSPKQALSPNAPFHQNGENQSFVTGDFWQWAFSDFQQNTLRGILAEFIVAKALGIPLNVRNSWDDYDLETATGLKIEVKSGGYLQSWQQKDLSKITFGGLRGKVWDREKCDYVGEAVYRADVYVFAVQTATTHDDFDPLDLDQWEFYVVPRELIVQRDTKSIAHSVVRTLAESVNFEELQRVLSQYP